MAASSRPTRLNWMDPVPGGLEGGAVGCWGTLDFMLGYRHFSLAATSRWVCVQPSPRVAV